MEYMNGFLFGILGGFFALSTIAGPTQGKSTFRAVLAWHIYSVASPARVLDDGIELFRRRGSRRRQQWAQANA